MTEPTWLNPGFRILISGFLHTRFVDLDFTVAKIITILPTGYRAQLLYASYCRRRPIDQVRVTLRCSVQRGVWPPLPRTVLSVTSGVCEGILLSAIALKPIHGGSEPIPERSVYGQLYRPSCAVLPGVAVDLPASLLIWCGNFTLKTPLSIPNPSVQDCDTRCAFFEVLFERYSVPVPATAFARLHFCSKRPPCLKASPPCYVQHISSERVASHCLTQRLRVTHFK